MMCQHLHSQVSRDLTIEGNERAVQWRVALLRILIVRLVRVGSFKLLFRFLAPSFVLRHTFPITLNDGPPLLQQLSAHSYFLSRPLNRVNLLAEERDAAELMLRSLFSGNDRVVVAPDVLNVVVRSAFVFLSAFCFLFDCSETKLGCGLHERRFARLQLATCCESSVVDIRKFFKVSRNDIRVKATKDVDRVQTRTC